MTSKTPTTPPLLLSPIYITISIFTDSTLIVVHRMDSDFIERIQRINLMEEEDEVVTVGRSQRGKILEECALSLLGRFLTTTTSEQPKDMIATVRMEAGAWTEDHRRRGGSVPIQVRTRKPANVGDE